MKQRRALEYGRHPSSLLKRPFVRNRPPIESQRMPPLMRSRKLSSRSRYSCPPARPQHRQRLATADLQPVDVQHTTAIVGLLQVGQIVDRDIVGGDQ